MSVHWLGDFVFVDSGLGVRVKFDLVNTVYVTVTAEHLGATRGLCGVYNNKADGEGMDWGDLTSHSNGKHKMSCCIINCAAVQVTLYLFCRR